MCSLIHIGYWHIKELGSFTRMRWSMAASHCCLQDALEVWWKTQSALPRMVWVVLSPLWLPLPNFLYSKGSQTLHTSELSGRSIKTNCWAHPWNFWLCRSGVRSKMCTPNNSQERLMQLIFGPHLENHFYMCQRWGEGTGDTRFLQGTILSPNYNHKESVI